MTATWNRLEERRDTLAAELAEAAFIAAARHGVQGSSVDLELSLWRAMRAALADRHYAALRRHDRRCVEPAVEHV